MSRAWTNLLVLLLFAALTLFHLWPMSLRPADGVRDPADPLLNSWILSRVNDQLVRDPLHLFQANMFYPYRDTLALSEHMLPLAAAAAPLYVGAGNAILAHNFVLWLAFILNGFGMFLLVRHLTHRVAAGILSGIVFTFCTYRFMHLSHIQLLASFWIPLGFLQLHKFLTERTWRASALFALFFVLQTLSCLYYGLFTAAVLALVLPLFLLSEKKIDGAFLARLAVPLAAAGAVLYAFSLPYSRAFAALGLTRGLMPGAELQNYVSVVPENIAFGRWLHPLGTHEKFLFPGLVACVFAFAAVAAAKRWTTEPASLRRFRLPLRIAKIAVWISAGLALAGVLVSLFGGLDLRWGFLKISMKSAEKPALYLFLLGAACLLLWAGAQARAKIVDDRRWIAGYAVLAAWAVALSFGGGFAFLGQSTKMVPMPFVFFFKYVPGFRGIREPVRFAVLAAFGIAVLAGFGMAKGVCRIRKKSLKAVLIGLVLAAVNFEYLSAPVESVSVPVGQDIPETYRWLEKQPGDSVILELPISEWLPGEAAYLYFATVHKKRLVNGYSGFIPASTFFLRDEFRDFPNGEAVSLLRSLGVNFLIVHAKALAAGKAPDLAARVASESAGALKFERRFQYSFSRNNEFEATFGDDYVFSITPAEAPAAATELKEPAALPRQKWMVAGPAQSGGAKAAIDGDLNTAWNPGRPKTAGDSFELDLGEVRSVRKISLQSGPSYYGYGLDFEVEASDDGRNWRPVAARFSPARFLQALLKDQIRAAQEIDLGECRARFLKITQSGRDAEYAWSIAEINIYE